MILIIKLNIKQQIILLIFRYSDKFYQLNQSV
jgi:hypothetical protein